jgi:predicted transcriptional regulator
MEPTERELQILKVLWERGEATVREVHAALSEQLPIVQNTVQAFLRIMENKRLVTHDMRGRSFVYRALLEPGHTKRELLSGVLEEVFDGALDALVTHAFEVKAPTDDELRRLRELLAEHEAGRREVGDGPAGERS